MKNPNGSYSIYKKSGHRRNPWVLVVSDGWVQHYDEHGVPIGKPKLRRRYLGWFATRKDALAAVALASKTNQDNDKQESAKIENKSNLEMVPTFAMLWSDVKKLRKARWAYTTYNNYLACYRRSEKIHNTPVNCITYKDLQLIMNDYMNGGHSSGSLKLQKVFFTMMFSEAVKQGYISSSPAQYVTYKATAEARHKKAIPEDTIKYIATRTDAPTHDIVMLLIYTGMRIEELLHLKPSDYHDTYVIAGEKTEAGKNRIIPIHPYISSTMRQFVRQRHDPYSTVLMHIVSDCKEYYGYEFRPHECRHTFITLANKYHMDLYALKRIVGHAAKDVTEAVYTHITVETLAKEIEKIPYPDKL
ncbi:MAG: tyrosine-type recombinase/integrase [Erysipelotrichaceae bacterium]|nr:tyrosine-type recombinase/integrase [Erysipelotrichaceae bacterium]